MPPLHWLTTIVLLAWQGVALAGEAPTREELERWFDAPPEKSARDVNEGQLHFLETPPPKPVHHHDNQVTITSRSLEDGWTLLRQCHENLDAVPRAQITFRPERVRGLRILSATDIGHVWVQDSTVQLRDVGPEARLCLTAESLNLTRGDDGIYVLRNGPYMRKFLDGYYPMRLTMSVEYKSAGLRLENLTPGPQKGFRVDIRPGRVKIEAIFEGELHTMVRFLPDPTTGHHIWD